MSARSTLQFETVDVRSGQRAYDATRSLPSPRPNDRFDGVGAASADGVEPPRFVRGVFFGLLVAAVGWFGIAQGVLYLVR